MLFPNVSGIQNQLWAVAFFQYAGQDGRTDDIMGIDRKKQDR